MTRPDRAARLSTLRWVVETGPRPEPELLWRGVDEMPVTLRALTAYRLLEGGAEIGAERREELESLLRAAAVVWLGRRAALYDALGALESVGIEAVVLKGAALGASVYPEPSLRSMSDHDLWIRRGDAAGAAEAMAAAGFVVPSRHGPDLSPLWEESKWERPGGRTPIMVELHTSLESLGTLSESEIEAIWSTRTRLDDVGLTVLSPDAQLLHIALHALRKHALVGRWRDIVDIALLCRAVSARGLWDGFVARSEPLRARASVGVALEVTRRLLEIDLPEVVPRRVAPDGLGDAPEWVVELLWRDEPALPKGVTRALGFARRHQDGVVGWVGGGAWARAGAERQRGVARLARAVRLAARHAAPRLGGVASLFTRGEILRGRFWRDLGTTRRMARLRERLERDEGRAHADSSGAPTPGGP